jgi:phosphatidylinositol kinase/protein kinase (PI-3  family)
MKSKEKPKKITLIADNGERFNFLCKTEKKGDLRKDSRIQEINSMVRAAVIFRSFFVNACRYYSG